MNICEAFKISNFVSSPDHNGLIRCYSNDGYGNGFTRIFFSENGDFNTYAYQITTSDLKRNDWEPMSLEVISKKAVVETQKPLEPSPLTDEERKIASELPEDEV